jgi:hypothetical protein
MVAALLQLSYQRFPNLAVHRTQEIEIIRLSLEGLKRRFPSAIGAERVVNQVRKHSTTLAKAQLLSPMGLNSEQREFFSPFGPEWCRMWPIIFDTEPTSLARTADVVGKASDLDPTSITEQSNHHEPQPQDEPVVVNSDPLWSHDGPLLFGEDDQTLFSNEQALDSVGRWWWQDWVPEADIDFLSKSW